VRQQGSERLSKSGSDQSPELMKEAMAINKSLSSLGSVIGALSKKVRATSTLPPPSSWVFDLTRAMHDEPQSPHVPFRDSKLTHLLSPSLGGDCKTLMICNLSPLGQHRDETLNSLRFAKTVNSCEIAFPSISSRSQRGE
jgi:kinesin family protein C1